jgi:hypothetical protein
MREISSVECPAPNKFSNWGRIMASGFPLDSIKNRTNRLLS